MSISYDDNHYTTGTSNKGVGYDLAGGQPKGREFSPWAQIQCKEKQHYKDEKTKKPNIRDTRYPKA